MYGQDHSFKDLWIFRDMNIIYCISLLTVLEQATLSKRHKIHIKETDKYVSRAKRLEKLSLSKITGTW